MLYLGATFVLEFFATIQMPTSASELRKVLRNLDALFAGLKCQGRWTLSNFGGPVIKEPHLIGFLQGKLRGSIRPLPYDFRRP